MAISEVLVLAGVCLFIACVGLWAISLIFPSARTTTPGSDPHHQQERPRT